MPSDLRPWLLGRPSNLEPRKVLHWIVGGWKEPTLEFIPIEQIDMRWWQAFSWICFPGIVRQADVRVEFSSVRPQWD